MEINVTRVRQVLGVAEVGGASVAVLTLIKTESIQLTLLAVLGTILVGTFRWAVGKIVDLVTAKIEGWEQNFITIGETLEDVPKRADLAALDKKVDRLRRIAIRSNVRLNDHSGKIKGIEDREHAAKDKEHVLIHDILSELSAEMRKRLT